MKAGDEIYLAKGSLISFCEVVGFRCYCTELKAGHHHILAAPYHRGLFYGFGYYNGERHLFLTRLWHYPFAVAVEAIRRHIPIKLSRFLKLEK